MAVTAVPMQAKVAMGAVSGLILLRLSLLRLARGHGMDAFILVRDMFAPPWTAVASLAVLAWAGWVTWRLGKANNDVRLLLQVLLAVDAFFFLLLMFFEYLPDWRL